MTGQPDLARTADLLNTVFATGTRRTVADLTWYYLENPEGPAAIGRYEEADRQLGNYSLIPFRLAGPDGDSLRLGLGVDLSVHPDGRGTGAFRRTVEHSYSEGVAAGLDGILGVANMQSAPRMVEAMGWRRLDPLPVRLLTVNPFGGKARVVRVDGELLEGDGLDRLLPTVPAPSAGGLGTVWSAELLRWRLAKPGARYTIHLFDDVLAVSTRTRMAGLRFAVLLKVIPRRPVERPVSSGRLAAALAAHHNTPLVVHWGINPTVRFRGIHLPRAFVPSPLELVLHLFETPPGGETRNLDGITLSTFEFLDFDAF